jgi:hypothetical protein
MRTFVVADGVECKPVGAPPFSNDSFSALVRAGAARLQHDRRRGRELDARPERVGALLVRQRRRDRHAGRALDRDHVPGRHGAGQTPRRLPAEAFARVGLSLADSFITCWKEKYTSYLMRPMTYITAHIDPLWTTLIPTPELPDVLVGPLDAVGCGGDRPGADVRRLPVHGHVPHAVEPELGFADRTFAGFPQAASEAAVSRMYGGIHFLFDNYDGIDSGVCVGSVHNSTLQFLADN